MNLHLRRVKATVVIADLSLLILFFLAGSCGLAQSIQGSIIGTVTDKAGAVVPAASVTLTNLDEGSIRTTVSSSSGEYQFIDTKAQSRRTGQVLCRQVACTP